MSKKIINKIANNFLFKVVLLSLLIGSYFSAFCELGDEKKTEEVKTTEAKLKTVIKKFVDSLAKGEVVDLSCLKAIMESINKGADVNIRGKEDVTPLFIATLLANKALIKFLIKNKVDINLATESGINSLLIALGLYQAASQDILPKEFEVINAKKYLDLIQFLLQNGAKLSPKIFDQSVSIDSLSLMEEEEIKDFLINKIFTTSIIKVLLIFLVKMNFVNAVKSILSNKNVDLNIKDENGDYLIHIAVLNENEKLVELLLKNNVTATLENSHGITPLDLAEIVGNEKIIKLINSYIKGDSESLHDFVKNS